MAQTMGKVSSWLLRCILQSHRLTVEHLLFAQVLRFRITFQVDVVGQKVARHRHSSKYDVIYQQPWGGRAMHQADRIPADPSHIECTIFPGDRISSVGKTFRGRLVG